MHDDALPAFARADLERLRLAAEIILRLAADDAIPAPLEAELTIFRDRVEHALLLPGQPAATAPGPGRPREDRAGLEAEHGCVPDNNE